MIKFYHAISRILINLNVNPVDFYPYLRTVCFSKSKVSRPNTFIKCFFYFFTLHILVFSFFFFTLLILFAGLSNSIDVIVRKKRSLLTADDMSTQREGHRKDLN